MNALKRRERVAITRYVTTNPEAAVSEVLGCYLINPTHQEEVADIMEFWRRIDS